MIAFRSLFITVLIGLAGGAGAVIAEGQSPTPKQLEFFEKQVRPLLANHCYECHSVNAKRVEAGLLLDSRKAQLSGGDSGEAIVPGDADSSILIEAVRYESYEMPPKGKLPEKDIRTLVRWVNMGAPWPTEPPPTADGAVGEFDLEKRKSEFWVWQPLSDPSTPEVADTTWARNDIDCHILRRLEDAGLTPSRDAERTAILRRLYFDLIGLPPTPEEIAEFMANTNDGAIEQVVDRLLESPHFGERWGRHWLDLVRYAESRGHEFDNDTPNAFQYRDYVIRALNADLPYDQFVREHIAGDLLEQPRIHPKQGFNESILGTGFWFLGEWVHSPVDIRKDESDRFDNMLDVMSKTFLGVTVACARCHDHKFDAISTADYYSLSGFLQSSDYRQVRFESMEQNSRVADQLAAVDKQYQQKIVEFLEEQGINAPAPVQPVEHAAVIVDYANAQPHDFMQDGFIFGQAPRRAGLPYLDSPHAALAQQSDPQSAKKPKTAKSKKAANEDSEIEAKQDRLPPAGQHEPRVQIATFGAAVNNPIWHGLESITAGAIQDRSAVAKLPKSGRTLRSPTFELKHGSVNCLVNGAGHIVACVDSHRLVAGPLHQQTIKQIKAGQDWVGLDLTRYIGHRLHLEFVPAANQQLTVRLITQGLNREQMAELDRRLDTQAKRFRKYATAAQSKLNNEKVRQFARDWLKDRQQLAEQIVRKSHVAPAMLDGTGEDDRILIRGNSSKPGDVEPRHFLTAIAGNSPMEIHVGSGRLGLADQINDPANPLASRVIVNRIWHHLLGRGIVPTVDDFGVLGQRPTHPKLLDHLATRFLNDGRSIKRMIKYIVLSRTYQMSSHFDPQSIATDPTNRLWHHCPPRRLQGEVIRDSLLAVSGRFDRTAFGPPVPIHLTSFMDGRGRPGTSGPLDGNGRRSIYVAVRRNFLSPFMLTFDTPAPFSSMGRRNVSNVPAQALILLNHPLVVELSGEWSMRALERIPGTDDEAIAGRTEWMYQCVFGRRPTLQEHDTATSFIRSQASERDIKSDNAELWASLAHVLVNTKEFIFLR